MRLKAAGMLWFLAVLVRFAASQPAVRPASIFNSDRGHIWNRLNDCLFVRETDDGKSFGADTIDPLLWDQTTHLLAGSSHQRALACLDEFLNAHGERLERDILKRAVLQHDLWSIFDWAAQTDDMPNARRELESRLAVAIRRLALKPDEIRRLPDTYAAAVASREFTTEYKSANVRAPFLPADLFRSGGPWVGVSAFSDKPVALSHFTGRSRFLVFMRLPAGREATLAYIKSLQSSSQPPLLKEGAIFVLNLALPQFPAGTQVALVRQAMVIDSAGRLQPTPLTESVQFRVYHDVTRGLRYQNYSNGPSSHDQDFFEFRMSRPQLFSRKSGGLRAVHTDEVEFSTFRTHGDDPFESAAAAGSPGVVLDRCRACHSDSGIHSVQSRLQWMQPVELVTHIDPIEAESTTTIARKQRQPDFQLLQQLWRTADN
jgi:hypothetical protein